MSFVFGFSGDDISDEDGDVLTELAQEVHRSTLHEEASIPPNKLDLKTLLASLPSQISCNRLTIPNIDHDAETKPTQQVQRIPRRSVFDIRTQLMAEADDNDNRNDMLLRGLDQGDLSSGTYEGGFKTWECSVDLAQMLSEYDLNPQHPDNDQPKSQSYHIVELGAGSAIPSMTLLQRAVSGVQTSPCQSYHFTICDYNEDVLKLCTAPNIFLNYLQASNKMPSGGQGTTGDHQDHDIDLEENDMAVNLDHMTETLKSADITFDLVSGAWGPAFLDLVTSDSKTSQSYQQLLILASETIYSPDTLPIFCDTLLTLLSRHHGPAKALVAAKKIYFGVGGGIEEFIREIRSRNGQTRTVFETTSAGVGRVIVEVTISSP